VGHRGDHGAPYDTVANLIGYAAANWKELDGRLLMRGVDLDELPVGRALNVLWAFAMEGRDEKERSRLIYQLTRPTPARAARMRDDFWAGHEEDAAAFMTAFRASGGSVEG
jgi:hypothetical protein